MEDSNEDIIHVLDHGYVKKEGGWGNDMDIIKAARMSTGGGFKGWGSKAVCADCHSPKGLLSCKCGGTETVTVPGDEQLLEYLWKNKHTTPFEMGGLTIEVCAPIFVFRQWHRHRTQSYNEASARYTPLPDTNYVPSVKRLMLNANEPNKQARGVSDTMLTRAKAERFRAHITKSYQNAETLYQKSLKDGVPKELARIHLPVGRYSTMRASANLLNWLRFLKLRLDKHAQWEIRQYAVAVGKLINERFPRTWDLFSEDFESS